MLEFNKEYTYQQICDALGWGKQTGCSKIAQINEIESCYEFYHPINKKTHKEKKSYIFTNQIKDVQVPSRQNNQGGNNIKNIKYMIDLVQAVGLPEIKPYSNGRQAKSFSYWSCDFYNIFNKDAASSIYKQSDVTVFCNAHGITREKLFCEYVALAKIEFKNMFLKSLSYLQKKDLAEYEEAYYFKYQLTKHGSTGKVFTSILDEIVKENEVAICDKFNDEYKFSSKLSGRQILFFIYKDEELFKQYRQECITMLMENLDVIDLLNEELEKQTNYFIYDTSCICDERPLLSYNRAVEIIGLEETTGDIGILVTEVSNQIRKRVRQQLFNKTFLDEESGKKMHLYTSDDACRDIIAIEKVLFTYYDIDFHDGTNLDLFAYDTVYDDSHLPF